MRAVIHKIMKTHTGLTMVEAIVVVGLLALLGAAAIPVVSAQVKQLEMTELNHSAKQIFLAAQVQIVSSKGAGIYTDLVSNAALPNVSLTDGTGSRNNFLVLSSSSASSSAGVQRLEEEFLPDGAVDHTINGQYAIAFDEGTGFIRGVLYRKSGIESGKIRSWIEDPALRVQDRVGYYGDEALAAPSLAQLPPPIMEIENGDELLLKVRLPAPWGSMSRHLQLRLIVEDANRPDSGDSFLATMDFVQGSGTSMSFFDRIDKSDLRFVTYIKVLDGGNRNGASMFRNFINDGADLLFTANLVIKPGNPPPGNTYYSPSTTVSQRSNMYFQSVDVQDEKLYIKVSSVRHLNNLGLFQSDMDIRKIKPGISDPFFYVEQVNDIDIYDSFRPRNTPFLRGYDGRGLEIRGYRISAGVNDSTGLFTEIGKTQLPGVNSRYTLKNINLVQCSITFGGVSNIGYLVGHAWNTDIINCHVYPAPGVAPIAQTLRVEKANVGGLVGYAENCTITDSSATFGTVDIHYNEASNLSYATGGLAGVMTGRSSVRRSYVYASQLQVSATRGASNKSAGMLVGWASGSLEVSASFAVGNLASTVGNVGGLVGNAGIRTNIHDCYSLVSFSGSKVGAGAIAGGSPGAIGVSTYYVLSLPGADVADPGGAIPLDDTDEMMNAGGGLWQFLDSGGRDPVNTRPMGSSHSGDVYPYPLPKQGRNEYIYRGNWP